MIQPRKRSLVALAAMSLTTLTLFAEADDQAPAELVRLKELRMRAVFKATKPIDDKFLKALEALKIKFTKAGELEAGIAISDEIKKFEENRLLDEKMSDSKPQIKSGDFDGHWLSIGGQTYKIKGLNILGDDGKRSSRIRISSSKKRKIEITNGQWTDYLYLSKSADMMIGKNNRSKIIWWRKVK